MTDGDGSGDRDEDVETPGEGSEGAAESEGDVANEPTNANASDSGEGDGEPDESGSDRPVDSNEEQPDGTETDGDCDGNDDEETVPDSDERTTDGDITDGEVEVAEDSPEPAENDGERAVAEDSPEPAEDDDERSGEESGESADDEAQDRGDGDGKHGADEDGQGEATEAEKSIERLQERYDEEGAGEWDPNDPNMEAGGGSYTDSDDDGDADGGNEADADDTSGDGETGPDDGAESGETDAEGASNDGEGSVQEGPGDRDPSGERATGATPVVGAEEEHAPDDEEMPLADHVEEMVRRLGVVLVLMAGVSAVIFPFGEQIINVIWYSFLPGTYQLCPTTSHVPTDPARVLTAAMVDIGAGPGVAMAEGATIKPACPRVYQPLATIFARFKVATLAGFVVALPAFVYETYLFMRPGLYPRERRYYLAAVPTSLVLATIGIAFAYLLVLPAIFTYFLYYSEGAADIAFGLTQTFDLMVLMMGFFAAIFQIPLFIMLAIMMGVTSRQWLADRRLLFWAAFAGIAFIFNPDPTGMAPFIVAATMIALFEGTLLLLSWTGSEGLLPSPDAVAARRPYAWILAGVAGYLASDAPLPEGYYDQLPGLLRGFIEGNDLLGMTPIVVGGLLIAVYEATVFLLRRYLPVGSWRRKLFSGRVSLFRLRSPVWIVSLVIGYLASPNPFLLDRAGAVGLAPIEAGALTVGLIVAFEALLALWKFRRPDEDERLPLER
ncbi:twin-arginine translocase subunit TatC [Halorhabdus rudnickae]|uniref:twin-arginine translocase subunit TatC n=1 Tax=Halorhabdus rudnickae TaxID=1775544 RepID=UPI0010830993|nr:twin-arginine translocase subunit TatC [Halorhabdus rudnickae]